MSDEDQLKETTGARSGGKPGSLISALSNVSLLSALFSLSGLAVLLVAYGYYIVKVVLNVFGIPTYLVVFDVNLFAETAVAFLFIVVESIVSLPITVFFTPAISAAVVALAAVVYLAVAVRAVASTVRRLTYITPVLDLAAVVSFFIAYGLSINLVVSATDIGAIAAGHQEPGIIIIGFNTLIGGLSLMSLGYLILVLVSFTASRWKTFNRLVASVYATMLIVNLLQIPQFWGVYSAYYARLPVVESGAREYIVLTRSRDRIFLYDPGQDKTVVRKVGLDDKYTIVGYKSRADYISLNGDRTDR